MVKLFSYVVDHDYGLAPNPFGGCCTLAKCKFGSGRFKNIVELAEEGDWIAGTGGVDLRKSAGHGKLIYAMRVDEKLPLAAYCNGGRFAKRIDAIPDLTRKGRFALVSRHFFYFGKNAIDIAEIPSRHLLHCFEKKGPGFRSDFRETFISDFAEWLETTFEVGVHGAPCGSNPKVKTPKCSYQMRRK